MIIESRTTPKLFNHWRWWFIRTLYHTVVNECKEQTIGVFIGNQNLEIIHFVQGTEPRIILINARFLHQIKSIETREEWTWFKHSHFSQTKHESSSYWNFGHLSHVDSRNSDIESSQICLSTRNVNKMCLIIGLC